MADVIFYFVNAIALLLGCTAVLTVFSICLSLPVIFQKVLKGLHVFNSPCAFTVIHLAQGSHASLEVLEST